MLTSTGKTEPSCAGTLSMIVTCLVHSRSINPRVAALRFGSMSGIVRDSSSSRLCKSRQNLLVDVENRSDFGSMISGRHH
jgi:hypothetical protein